MNEPTTAAEVLRRALRHWNYGKDQIIPRCCLPGWEADLLVIKPSGWMEEVEIKISAADFRREWSEKVEKHRALAEGRRELVGWMNLEGERMLYAQHREALRPDDPRIEVEERPCLSFLHLPGQPHLIRRFWFAMPRSLAEKLLPEVPAAYGVLAVGGYNQVLREPTNLGLARKVTDAERIKALHSTYYRFWQLFLRERDETLKELCLAVAPGGESEEA